MATTEHAQDTHPGSDADAVRTVVNERGIEFLFAQFVDMHGKPSAKLVPATHLDGLFEDGAGFAGFAAGSCGGTWWPMLSVGVGVSVGVNVNVLVGVLVGVKV